jgi:mono/diheme cytochrome c family protein
MKKTTKGVLIFAAGLVVVFALIQLVPYGRQHTNPAVKTEPKWDSPQTLALAKRACFDCHSNETNWPWYSNVAPFSWLVQYDVDRGRRSVNFSDWAGAGGADPSFVVNRVSDGKMPPIQFTLLHPEAQLTDAERQQLIQGFLKSLAQ